MLFSAFRQPRLWLTLLWSLTLGAGVSGWDWAERQLALRAAAEPMLLLPDREPSDDQRRESERSLRAEPGIDVVHWISPAELELAFGRRFNDERWKNLLPGAEQGGLAWLLEVRAASPLDNLAALEGFAGRRRQEGTWGVLWDGDRLRALAAERKQLRGFLGLGLALVLLSGMAGLRALPWPSPGGASVWIWSALLGAAGPASLVAAAMLSGANVDARAAGLGVAAGFLLAAGIAPVLRQPVKKRINLTVSEAPDELPRSHDHL